MKQAIFYIESPFQLLQAFEALGYYQVRRYKMMIRCNLSNNNNLQILKLIEELGLENISIFKSQASRFSKFWLAMRIQSKILFSRNVFIGDEFSGVFRVLKRLNSQRKFILMDDGVATFQSKKKLKAQRFSIFNLNNELEAPKNTFPHIKGMIEQRAQQRKVSLIVGSKLVEVGICSLECYLKAIKKMLSELEGDEVIYVPHRDENDNNVRLYEQTFSLEVCRNQLPIELIGKEFAIKVDKVVSTFSTALFTMPMIYPAAKFYSLVLSEEDLVERKAAVLNLYKKIGASGLVKELVF